MTFSQFAWNNVTRNARAYVAFFLCSTFSVSIFFSYAIFMFHPKLLNNELGMSVKAGMTAAEYVIFLFSFFFVLYSVSSFLKARKKEFGILTILGAEQTHMYTLIFMENIIIGALAIVSGLGLGLLFSKLFLLLSTEMTGLEGLNFYFPTQAIGLTTGAFAALFFIISFTTMFFLRNQQTMELLKGTSKPKTEPKASIFLSLLSVACIGGSFFLIQRDIGQTYLYVLGLGSIGTYFFFTQLSVFMIRILKRSQTFFYRGVNLLWLSEMAYKIKDSARIFFIITVVTAMACGFLSIVLSEDSQNKREFINKPFAIQYKSYDTLNSEWDQDVQRIDQILDHNEIAYDKIQYESVNVNFEEEASGSFAVTRLSDYKQLAGIYDLPNIDALADRELVLLNNSSSSFTDSGQRKTDGFRSYTNLTVSTFSFDVMMQETVTIPNIYDEQIVVISDQQYNDLYEQVLEVPKGRSSSAAVFYRITEWSNDDLPVEDSIESKVTGEINNVINQDLGFISLRALDFLQVQQTTSIFKFVWIFIAAIFSVSSISFLYFKLYSDLQADQRMYQSLSRMGLTEQEMSTSASIQLAILFFLPLFIASLGAIITVELIRPELAIASTIQSSLTVVLGYFIIQVVYFILIRALYVQKLKKAMF
ncbi:ABC transporter permease [Paenibacillus sp. IHBB 10380]|uniref:ABC transporter permease n=1 Tax=Paenibacillus sp. IHBB 10380 TaxID=1566358 RepID=UPI000696962C|nr:ABC transporter permease [Paenibacillus sp. IHBB 10380]